MISIHNNNISNRLLNAIKKIDKEGVSSYLNDPYTFTTGIVYSTINDKDEIVAAGIIRVVNELKVILKPELSDILKAKALKLLLDTSTSMMQCNEAVAIITQGGDHYVNILKDHFNFFEEPGTFLRLEVKNGRNKGTTTKSG